MAWIYLFAAGITEIAWAIGLRYSGGLSRPWPSVATVAGNVGLKLLSAQPEPN